MAEQVRPEKFGGPQFYPFGVEGFVFLKILDKIGGGTNLEVFMALRQQAAGIGLPLNSLHQLSLALEEGKWIEKTGTVPVQLTEDTIEVPKWAITTLGRVTIYNNIRMLKVLNKFLRQWRISSAAARNLIGQLSGKRRGAESAIKRILPSIDFEFGTRCDIGYVIVIMFCS